MNYVTIKDGMNFRDIAKIMSNKNYKMNHATARSVLLNSLRELLKNIGKEFNLKLTDEDLEKMLKNQILHNALMDILLKVSIEEILNEK